MKCKRDIVLLVVLFAALSINAQTLIVEIGGIRNNYGKIVLSVFTDNNGFKKDESVFEKSYNKSDLDAAKMLVEINIDNGIYGIAILDDENSNGKMDYNLIGIPKEGYGFSNFYHTVMIRPKFEDFSFIINNKNETIQVRLKYF